MKQTIAIALVALVAGYSPADDSKFDPAATARLIAPFVGEQAFAVVRVDLAAVDIDEWASRLTKWTGMTGKELNEPRMRLRDMQGQLRKAGAREIYVVLSLADLPGGVPILVPTGPGTNAAAIVAAFEFLSPPASMEANGIVAVGPNSAIDRLKSLKPSPRPDLATALAAVPNTIVQAVLVPGPDQRRVVEEMLPKLPAELGGGPGSILSRGVRWAAFGIEAPPKAALRLIIQSSDPAAAQALEGVIGKAVEFAAKAGVEMELDLKPLIPVLKPKISGDQLTLSVREDDSAVAALVVGMANKARASASRMASMSNLKQLALAMHMYADTYRSTFPAHAIYSKDGATPLLSWRVAILPFLDQEQLYKKFKLDEPWDSPNNKALIPLMPKVYLDPLAPRGADPGLTNYQVFVGPKAPWDNSSKGPSLPRTFTDGTSNTILIAQAADPVIWTKPEDLAFDPTKPLPKLGINPKLGFLVAMCDGSVRWIGPKVPEQTRKAAITPAGGEVLGPDW